MRPKNKILTSDNISGSGLNICQRDSILSPVFTRQQLGSIHCSDRKLQDTRVPFGIGER